MDLFLSTYVNKVDRKGRVSVPATFRSALSSQRDPNAIIVSPSIRFEALDGRGGDRMEEIQRRLETLEEFSDEHENLTMMFAESHRLPIDGEGRVMLPDILKKYAHIDGDAAFVGRGAKFEIWEPLRFEAHRVAINQRARQQNTTIPGSGGPRRPQ